MENNETIIKLLRVLVDNFDIELYKNLYTREIENNTENGRCMFMSHDIKCSQADYFTEPEISRLLKILSPLDKSTLEELLIDPKERAAKRAKTAAERKEFMDFWSAESLEKHLQNPDLKVSSLAKVECYCYKEGAGRQNGGHLRVPKLLFFVYRSREGCSTEKSQFYMYMDQRASAGF